MKSLNEFLNEKSVSPIEGTLSLWKDKWKVSYTTSDGDLRGEQAPEVHPSQVNDIKKYKDYINKRHGVDVEFIIDNGYAKLLSTEIDK